MNCLYYCDWYEQYTAELVSAVAAGPHTVSLVVREQAPEFAGQGRSADGHRLRRELQRSIHRLHVLPGRYWSVRSLRQVRRIVRQTKPDVFHLQQTSDPRFLWVLLRVPTVLTLHEPVSRPGNRLEHSFRQSAGSAMQWFYRRFARLIVVHTRTNLLSLSKREQRKAVVIPHGCPVLPLESSEDTATILAFGRSDSYKGFGTLLAAMELVWESEPSARLEILASPGNTQYEVSDARVTATWGGYSDSDLTAALSRAQAICLPYTTASGSGAGAQAYGARKPIIASNLEGLRELVSRPELLVEPGDVADLARAIQLVLAHDYGVQPIDPERTWPGVAKAHLRAYTQMLRGSETLRG